MVYQSRDRPLWDRAPILSGFEAEVYQSRAEAVMGSGPKSVLGVRPASHQSFPSYTVAGRGWSEYIE